MKTQIEFAREGICTDQMQQVAAAESQDPTTVQNLVARGEIVIANHPGRPHQKTVGIGTDLRTKVNASINTSSDICDVDLECRKAWAAEEEGAETLEAPSWCCLFHCGRIQEMLTKQGVGMGK